MAPKQADLDGKEPQRRELRLPGKLDKVLKNEASKIDWSANAFAVEILSFVLTNKELLNTIFKNKRT